MIYDEQYLSFNDKDKYYNEAYAELIDQWSDEYGQKFIKSKEAKALRGYPKRVISPQECH